MCTHKTRPEHALCTDGAGASRRPGVCVCVRHYRHRTCRYLRALLGFTNHILTQCEIIHVGVSEIEFEYFIAIQMYRMHMCERSQLIDIRKTNSGKAVLKKYMV